MENALPNPRPVIEPSHKDAAGQALGFFSLSMAIVEPVEFMGFAMWCGGRVCENWTRFHLAVFVVYLVLWIVALNFFFRKKFKKAFYVSIGGLSIFGLLVFLYFGWPAIEPMLGIKS